MGTLKEVLSVSLLGIIPVPLMVTDTYHVGHTSGNRFNLVKEDVPLQKIYAIQYHTQWNLSLLVTNHCRKAPSIGNVSYVEDKADVVHHFIY